MKVVGRFLAPDNSPLSGAVSLTPSVPVISVVDGQVVQTAVSADLDADGRVALEVVSPGEGVALSSFSYRVRFALKHGGLSVPAKSFEIMAQDGTVDLKTVTPLPDPVTGGYVVRGKSAYEVWLDAGNTGTVQDFLASLGNGGVVSAGGDLVGVSIEGSKLMVTHANGVVESFALPAGGGMVPAGAVSGLSFADGTAYWDADGKRSYADLFTVLGGAPVVSLETTEAGLRVSYGNGGFNTVELPVPAVQDTGWRDITAQLGDDVANRHTPYGFKVLLRRVGDMVTLKFVGVVYKANATYQNFFTLPSGFTNQYAENTAMFKAGTNLIGQSISVERSNVTVYSLNGVETYGSIRWLTNDVFPSYLPGVPA